MAPKRTKEQREITKLAKKSIVAGQGKGEENRQEVMKKAGWKEAKARSNW